MNLKKLIKELETETDNEKAAETIRKIDSLINEKGVLRMGPFGYLNLIYVKEILLKKGTLIAMHGETTGDILYGRTVYISNQTTTELKSYCQ